MATSNTYTFGQTQLDEIVRESFERTGIVGDLITAQKVQSAIYSMNLMFSAWVNKGLNLFLRQQNMMDIVPGQIGYLLPENTVDILELTVANTTRLITDTGIPYSSAGVAANAFDGSDATFCDTGSPQGYIGYQFPLEKKSVNYVGIVSDTTSTYDLMVEYSFDGVTYLNALYIPSQQFLRKQRYWFVVKGPVAATYWRIKGTAKNQENLNMDEVYFSIPSTGESAAQSSRLISRMSWETYMAVSQKDLLGSPGNFLIDRVDVPTLKLWPIPTTEFSHIIYNTSRYVQDVTTLAQNMEIPTRFYEAAISDLASRLALKFAPDRFPLLKQEAQEAYDAAAGEDYERADLVFQPDLTAYSY